MLRLFAPLIVAMQRHSMPAFSMHGHDPISEMMQAFFPEEMSTPSRGSARHATGTRDAQQTSKSSTHGSKPTSRSTVTVSSTTTVSGTTTGSGTLAEGASSESRALTEMSRKAIKACVS